MFCARPQIASISAMYWIIMLVTVILTLVSTAVQLHYFILKVVVVCLQLLCDTDTNTDNSLFWQFKDKSSNQYSILKLNTNTFNVAYSKRLWSRKLNSLIDSACLSHKFTGARLLRCAVQLNRWRTSCGLTPQSTIETFFIFYLVTW